MLPIHIVSLLYIETVVLSTPMTGFSINNGLVISYTMNIIRPADGVKTRSADVKRLTNTKELADAKELVNAEAPVDT